MKTDLLIAAVCMVAGLLAGYSLSSEEQSSLKKTIEVQSAYIDASDELLDCVCNAADWDTDEFSEKVMQSDAYNRYEAACERMNMYDL